MTTEVAKSEIHMTDRDLIYTRRFYEVEMSVKGTRFCLWVEEEDGVVINKWLEGEKYKYIWNTLSAEQIAEIESILRDEFEL